MQNLPLGAKQQLEEDLQLLIEFLIQVCLQ